MPTLEERAKNIAHHTDAHCGDCPCPRELGGPGYCEALYERALMHMREIEAEWRKDIRENF